MFKRVLIANRGEIAIRIARAASALGVESVAVYAPADALSLHTRVATQARAIGSPTGDPVAAYLDIEGLIAVARATGCDCVHPGYGFLAENAQFARRCLAEGLAFIGPRADTLTLFGDKTKARDLARAEGVPIVPGSPEAVATAEAASASANALSYPVMLKAAAGGGGRGMRAVQGPEAMAAAFERCRSEARAAFGDGTLFLERLIARPRHIEVQVLADAAGGLVHLHERDCSVQLRNQKVIEIAPAPSLDAGQRAHRTRLSIHCNRVRTEGRAGCRARQRRAARGSPSLRSVCSRRQRIHQTQRLGPANPHLPHRLLNLLRLSLLIFSDRLLRRA